jgi:MoaA/NifB/PqqE/SkfB family radical SAM enzyme
MCTLATDPHKRTMRFEVFEEAVTTLGSMGCQYISIAGGEPLAVEDVGAYLRAAKRHVPVVHVVTSGFTMSPALAREIAALGVDSVAVSLDGFEHTHDAIRGVRGAYRRALRAIRLLADAMPDAELTVNTVIMPENVAELKDLVMQSESLGCRHKFQPVNYHPKIAESAGERYDWEFDERSARKLRDFLRWVRRRPSVSNGAYFLAHVYRYLVDKRNPRLLPGRCLLPYFFCQMREDEKLYPCLTGLDWKSGVSLQNGFAQAYLSPEYGRLQGSLESCRLCQRYMQICYVEPRAMFPLSSLVRYELPAWVATRMGWRPSCC